MLWFSVWTVLVVATIVGAVLLALSLWRKGKALLRQLEETGRVLDLLQTRVDELDAARPPAPSFRPALLADDRQRDHWRNLRALNIERRAERRRRRHAVAYRRWHGIVG